MKEINHLHKIYFPVLLNYCGLKKVKNSVYQCVIRISKTIDTNQSEILLVVSGIFLLWLDV